MLCLIFLSSCKDNTNVSPAIDETLNEEVLESFSDNLAVTVYQDLQAKANLLYNDVQSLSQDGATQDELEACQSAWRAARQAWEQSEAFLFGPVSTENIDPRIDTWPVNFTDLDAQLDSDHAFTESYINNLEDALKGFHPIEYLIFGEGGNKTANQLTARDLEYLQGLTLNLTTLTTQLADQWNKDDLSSYYFQFIEAGKGSSTYGTQRAAFEEMVNAMVDICDEVANGKLTEPFVASDPSLEESPFSKNSFVDFTNNITGVQDVYLGKYLTDGMGLEDMVRKNNLQLDGEIKTSLNTAISTLNNFAEPFGAAIIDQRVQVQKAIDAVNDLKTLLEEKLLPYVQQHTN